MNILRDISFILFFASFGLTTIGYTQSIQKWVDKDGKVHYGEPTAFDQPVQKEKIAIYNTYVSESDKAAAAKRGKEADAWYRADIRSRNARESRQRAEEARLQESLIRGGSHGSGGRSITTSSGSYGGSGGGASSDEIDRRIDERFAERDMIRKQQEYIANKRARGESIPQPTVKRVGTSR